MYNVYMNNKMAAPEIIHICKSGMGLYNFKKEVE